MNSSFAVDLSIAPCSQLASTPLAKITDIELVPFFDNYTRVLYIDTGNQVLSFINHTCGNVNCRYFNLLYSISSNDSVNMVLVQAIFNKGWKV